MSSIKSKDLFLVFSVGIIFVLGGVIYYLLPYYSESQESLKYQVFQESPKDFKRKELEKEFYKIIERLNQEKEQNIKFSEIIDEQKVEMLGLKEEIEKKIEAGLDLASLERELAVFRAQSSKNLKDISQLKEEKASLKKAIEKAQTNNEALLAYNIKKVKQVDSLQKELTKNKREVLKEKKINQSLINEKINLETDIEKVKFIPLSALDVTPINAKKNKNFTSFNSKKVDYLSICFNTAPNVFLKDGLQDFYVSLIDESEGIPVKIGGDYAQLKDGSEVRFVRVVEVEYVQDYMNHCFKVWPQKQLEYGRYIIKIYNNGHLVGETNFVLQKGGLF